jgi:hypothetical protein
LTSKLPAITYCIYHQARGAAQRFIM